MAVDSLIFRLGGEQTGKGFQGPLTPRPKALDYPTPVLFLPQS